MKKILGLLIAVSLTAGMSGFGQSYLEEVRACQLLEQGKPDEAVRLLSRKLQRYPRNYDCHLYLGVAHLVRGDAEKALKSLNKVELETEKLSGSTAAMTSDRSYADINRVAGGGGLVFTRGKRGILKYALGILLKGQKDYKGAHKRFEDAVKYKYPEAPARRQLVMLDCFLKDHKRAAKDMEKLRKAGETGDPVDFLSAYIAYYTKKVEAAVTGFTGLSETMLLARRNLAVIHYNQGEYQQALDIWLAILEESPKDADSLRNSGRAYHHLGQTEKGQAQFDILGFKMKVEKYSPKTIPLLLVDLFPEPEFDFMCQAK